MEKESTAADASSAALNLKAILAARDDPDRLHQLPATVAGETDEDQRLRKTAEDLDLKPPATAAADVASTTSDPPVAFDNSSLKEELERVKLNPFKLRKFIELLGKTKIHLAKNNDLENHGECCTLLGTATNIYDTLTKTREPISARGTSRVADIRFRVNEEKLLVDFDLIQLLMRVLGLFAWHDKNDDSERTKYIAPYIPLVQSSGMGKTKLLVELLKKIQRNEEDAFSQYECRTILCTAAVPEKETLYTDHLVIEDSTPSEEWRNEIAVKLHAILKRCKKDKVIFLFDETQILLESDGFCFRCVRWWLRQKDLPKSVVAVFTGTTSRLSNFYKEPPESNFSRNAANDYHDEGKSLYPPFHELCTIGVFAAVPNKRCCDPNASEYQKAIPYGRPLFALMDKEKITAEAAREKEWSILRRMLLGVPSTPEWSDSAKACISVLGTRVQMGQTTTILSSELVSKGYAVLTHYSAVPDEDKSHSDSLAQIAFLPDPVCARLAMMLMDEHKKISWSGKDLKGRSKVFWVQKMSDMFCTGLCRPNQGDLGEIAAATYLLFCGDLLRKRLEGNDDYTKFSVSLLDFVRCVLQPNEFCGDVTVPSSIPEEENTTPNAAKKVQAITASASKRAAEPEGRLRRSKRNVKDLSSDGTSSALSNDDERPSAKRPKQKQMVQNTEKSKEISSDGTSTAFQSDDKLLLKRPMLEQLVQSTKFEDASVNFIQVVRNYIRFSMKHFTKQSFLKGLYESGCAFYVYEKFHVIDMVASIRLTPLGEAGAYFFVPLLVSVSTKNVVRSEKEKLQQMTRLLTKAGAFGLCIHMIFGLDETQPQAQELLSTDDVEDLLCGNIVSKVTMVADDDPFQIVQTLLQTTSMGPARAEVYSSHSYLNPPFLENGDDTKSLVRSKASEDLLEYIRQLGTRKFES